MLGKLIKYEFKSSGRLIPIIYLIVGLLTVTGVLLTFANLYIYTAIAFILLFLAGAAALVTTYVVIFLRFYHGMFGSEGYLAMTLPVTSGQLYLSKTIVAAIWLFLSNLVCIVSWIASFCSIMLMVAHESGMNWGDIQEEVRWAFDTFTSEELLLFQQLFSPGIIIFSIVIGIIGFLSLTSQIYFCVTLSNVRPFQRLGIGAAIIAFVVLWIVNSVLNNVLTYFLPLSLTFAPQAGWSISTQSMWSSMNEYYSTSFSMGLGGYILPIFYALILPIFTIRLIKHRVTLK